MKIKIVVVAPYPGLVELTTSLREELKEFEIKVLQGDLSEVLPLMNRIHLDGYDVIISRGGTARLLRKHSYLPVIDIQVSGFDIMRILMVVKGYQAKIKMIGFPNIIEGFISVSGLMEVDIPYASVQQESEVDEALRLAKAEGVKVIVGDNITVRKANEHGMQGVLITSGRESVLEAFAQAKQIYKVSESYKQKKLAFERLLDTMDTGYAIVNDKGIIQFSNEAFNAWFHLPENQTGLYTDYPVFSRYMADLDKGAALELLVQLDGQRQVAVSGGKMNDDAGEGMFYLKVRPVEQPGSGITMMYTSKQDIAFPPLVMTDHEFAGQSPSERAYPLAVFGETGAGKRLFAIKRWSSMPQSGSGMIELSITKRYDAAALAALRKLLSTDDEELIIYIRGVDQLSLADQRELVPVLAAAPGKIILSFDHSPLELKSSNALDGKLYDTFAGRIVSMPPLRERLDDLDEYIRTFLIMYNERYGKQIVGLRPEVMKALRSHEWRGNLFELRNVIDQFVRSSDGEYVEAERVELLKQAGSGFGPGGHDGSEHSSVAGGLDLSKTLDEIEYDIIRTVLEQEDMNQSAAAKRLGINRSTLWRKMKPSGS
ncbi:PrpR N-terminal domain-containing protein [Paenibacillus algorifonticola]|uniref:PrpR N-terminal domain-containing protein n=1 Tax=Paenibacillus algorifonticola TaxID=684063 RepID=UPI003D26AF95